MRTIDADRLQKQFDEKSTNPNYRVNMHNIKSIISNAPTVEAIPKADYETHLKADMVAMLTEIQLEIREIEEDMCIRDSKAEMGFNRWIKKSDAENIIWEKINNLKRVEE